MAEHRVSSPARVGGPATIAIALLFAGCFEAAHNPPWGADAEADAAIEADPDAPEADADADDDDDNEAELGPASLLVPPLVHSPTANAVSVNAVAVDGRESLRLEWRPASAEPAEPWTRLTGRLRGEDVREWRITGLQAATRYMYRLIDGSGELYRGSFITQRRIDESFTFALISDTHVFVDSPTSVAWAIEPSAALMALDNPDLVFHLGDLVDYHAFGFNDPPPDESWPRLGMLSYREMMGDLVGHAAHFTVIGNWDGENGCFSDEEIEISRSQRWLYLPTPTPDIYPEGGSERRDYYAFTWGDALFVALNVMSYTETEHLLSPGPADDWTLGAEQFAWLEQTLTQATARWRFLLIHHPVGGNGGDGPTGSNSAYGRGGGRAAYVGQQAEVHDLMLQHDVQVFFYGHDHVFFDMEVDGVHYTLPGSAGAPWKFSTAETGYEEYFPDSGYGRVHVTPDRLTIEFVSIEGTVLQTIEID